MLADKTTYKKLETLVLLNLFNNNLIDEAINHIKTKSWLKNPIMSKVCAKTKSLQKEYASYLEKQKKIKKKRQNKHDESLIIPQ